MVVGEVLKEVRKEKEMSQGDIENRTGMLRCYVSRVENGHTVPSFETLEKFARALEVPLWQIVRGAGSDGEPIPAPVLRSNNDKMPRALTAELSQVARAMERMSPQNRKLLVGIARRMAK